MKPLKIVIVFLLSALLFVEGCRASVQLGDDHHRRSQVILPNTGMA